MIKKFLFKILGLIFLTLLIISTLIDGFKNGTFRSIVTDPTILIVPIIFSTVVVLVGLFYRKMNNEKGKNILRIIFFGGIVIFIITSLFFQVRFFGLLFWFLKEMASDDSTNSFPLAFIISITISIIIGLAIYALFLTFFVKKFIKYFKLVSHK